jgi:hypothetical protein
MIGRAWQFAASIPQKPSLVGSSQSLLVTARRSRGAIWHATELPECDEMLTLPLPQSLLAPLLGNKSVRQ